MYGRVSDIKDRIEDKYLWMSAVRTAINENLDQMNFYKHDYT